jgi:hypothetical protein
MYALLEILVLGTSAITLSVLLVAIALGLSDVDLEVEGER